MTPCNEVDIRRVLDAMADTLRGVLMVVDQPEPYPWEQGHFKQQIREDLAAYDLLGLDAPADPLPGEKP